jgi:hypothetical protein
MDDSEFPISRGAFGEIARRLLNGARARAAKANVGFDLTDSFLLGKWDELGGRCQVSGIRFADDSFPQALVKHPFRPSLDRIIPGGDYDTDNVRLVCVCANFSMNEWGLATLVGLADAVVDHHRNQGQISTLISLWRARLEGQTEEAMVAASRMPPDVAKSYRRRIASLRRVLTLSPNGLRAAAAKERKTIAEKAIVLPDKSRC